VKGFSEDQDRWCGNLIGNRSVRKSGDGTEKGGGSVKKNEGRPGRSAEEQGFKKGEQEAELPNGESSSSDVRTDSIRNGV